MNNKTQATIELMYDSKKKSMVVAYILGLFLGSFGAHFFYAGREDLGGITLAGLAMVLIAPIPFTAIWSIWIISGVVVTYYVVNSVNAKIRKQLEIIYGDEENNNEEF